MRYGMISNVTDMDERDTTKVSKIFWVLVLIGAIARLLCVVIVLYI